MEVGTAFIGTNIMSGFSIDFIGTILGRGTKDSQKIAHLAVLRIPTQNSQRAGRAAGLMEEW